jgi:predicted small lipoprotein YifL
MCSEVPRRLWKPLAGLLLLAALTTTAGCGKKGPPLPPLRFVPATVKDLIASQQGTRVLLDFAYPKVTAAGQALGTVTEVDVYEVTRPVPGATAPPVLTPAPGVTAPTPPAAPGAAGPKAPATQATPPATSATPPVTTPAVPTTPAPATTPPTAPAPAISAPAVPATPSTTPATLPTSATPATPPGTLSAAPTATTPAAAATPAAPAAATAPEEPPPLPGREYTSSAKVRLKLKGAEVGAATQGDRIVVELPYPEKTEVHYFTVKTLGPHGDPSGYSNQVVILPRPAPAPPADTKIMARAEGVEIAWTEPAAPGSGRVIGYNIYRRYSQTKGFGPALHASAATDRSYVDTSAQYGQGYIYTVTAVAHRNPVIESAIKTEGEIKYIDRFPPPVPREPVTLVEPGRVRVVWRGSEAADLAGYKVYRLDTKKAKAEYELLTATPITEVEYTDSTVKAGGTYAYRITAIDQLGNESEPAEVRATAQ